MSLAVAPKVTCRQIEDDDLDAVIGLLARGFSERPRHYWLTGFARLKRRTVPPGCPRYGLMLDCAGRPVGVMLMLFSTVAVDGEARQRCNLSSWYVDPAFGAHAGSLVLNVLRRKAVTYTNLSAATHTLGTVRAVKFLPYTTGYRIVAPAVRQSGVRCRVHAVTGPSSLARFAALPERDLLLDHAAMGCLCLLAEDDTGLHPFVFLRFRLRAGRWPLPIQHLIYCRGLADFARLAGPIGRRLLRRGTPLVAFDTDGADFGLGGLFRPHATPRFYRGLDKPRLGDLAYSERVIFGP